MSDGRGRGVRKTVKLCECGRVVESAHNRAIRCNLCKAADPHRNRTRQVKRNEIAVAIDMEGHQADDGIMRFITASFGREDGSADTLMATGTEGHLTAFQVARWLLDHCAGSYTDVNGNQRVQVPMGFHLKWDSAVMARDFALDTTTYLIHKRGQQKHDLTPLCWSDVEHECDKIHRTDREAVVSALDYGEKDLLAYHPGSDMAFVFSPGRRLYIEHRPEGDRYNRGRVLDVHDIGTAFTGGLLKVINDWSPQLTDEQQAIIEWGKLARKGDVFGDSAERDKVKEYSEAECVATARCARELVNSLKSAFQMQMEMSDLYGSGSVAAAALKHFGVTKREQTHEDVEPFMGFNLWDLGRLTYFGGQIEAPVVGLIPGFIDEVDINSAYPAQAIKLPCMRSGHGHWVRHKRYTRKVVIPAHTTLGYVRCSWAVETPSSPPFSIRLPNGSVRTTKAGKNTWVTLAEYRAAVAQFGAIQIQAHSIVWWNQDCECEPPLRQLADAYKRRADIKAQMKGLQEGTPEWRLLECQQMAIKLVINSVYGKLAQQKPELGPYTNMHYAAFVTGATRAMVRVETWEQEARGGLVVYQHTDSVLSQGGNPQDRGKDLGAWGKEESSEDMLILQPGLAVAFGGHRKTATRGVNKVIFKATAMEWSAENDFTTHPENWKMTIHQESMMSWGLAVMQNKIEKAGSFNPQTKEIQVLSTKRDFSNAKQLPCKTAWQIPPVDYVPAVASVDDLLQYRSKMEILLDAAKNENVGKMR
jgi:hypothetical protein